MFSAFWREQPAAVTRRGGLHLFTRSRFAGNTGEPFSNRAFSLRLRLASRALWSREITAFGPRHSATTILLNDVGKDLREIQELLRHKNTRTTVRYTRRLRADRLTAEALSRASNEADIQEIASTTS